MTVTQEIIMIGACVIGTMLTRFIPFFIFKSSKPTPAYIQYLGKVLPPATMSLLVIYSLKNINFMTGHQGIPELLASAVTCVLHIVFRNMFISMGVGTGIYIYLVQFVYI